MAILNWEGAIRAEYGNRRNNRDLSGYRQLEQLETDIYNDVGIFNKEYIRFFMSLTCATMPVLLSNLYDRSAALIVGTKHRFANII